MARQVKSPRFSKAPAAAPDRADRDGAARARTRRDGAPRGDVEVRERRATTGDLLREIVPELVVLAGAASLFVLAGDFSSRQQPGQLGPGFWPRLAAIGLALALVARIVQAIRAHRRPVVRVAGEFDDVRDEAAPVHWRSVAVAIGLVAGYVLATMFVGYMIATMAFLTAFIWLGGERRWAAPVVGVLGGLVLTYVFVGVVYVSVPTGVSVFDSLTVAVYRLLGIQ